jgi:thioredoxin 1
MIIIQKLLLTLVVVSFFLSISQGTVLALNPKEVPIKGMVNLIDLGADSCLPCKMMAPILTKLEKNYKGKAVIVFIDVSKFPDQVKRFGIRTIPTQIFFDKKGKEVYRHEGFMSEKQNIEIIDHIQKIGTN